MTPEPDEKVIELLETLLGLARSGEIQSVAVAVAGPKFDGLDYTASYSNDLRELATIRVQLGALAHGLDRLHYETAGKQREEAKKRPTLTVVKDPPGG